MGNKIFIIQLMNGRSDEEIQYERKYVETKLRECGYDPINSFIQDNAPNSVNAPVWYLGRSIEMLSKADYIYSIPGWEAGRGCRIEKAVAREYGIPEAKL